MTETTSFPIDEGAQVNQATTAENSTAVISDAVSEGSQPAESVLAGLSPEEKRAATEQAKRLFDQFISGTDAERAAIEAQIEAASPQVQSVLRGELKRLQMDRDDEEGQAKERQKLQQDAIEHLKKGLDLFGMALTSSRELHFINVRMAGDYQVALQQFTQKVETATDVESLATALITVADTVEQRMLPAVQRSVSAVTDYYGGSLPSDTQGEIRQFDSFRKAFEEVRNRGILLRAKAR